MSRYFHSAVVTIADKIHVRHCIIFLFNFGKSAAETKRMIDEEYGKDSIGMSTVREWFAKFKKGGFRPAKQAKK